MKIQKIYHTLILLFLFLLPWQTRYIWQGGMLNEGHWEYGTFSIYATEILLWVILVLFFVQNFLKKEVWANLFSRRKNTVRLLFLLGCIAIGISVRLSENFWVSYQYLFRLLEALALSMVLVRSQSIVILSKAKNPLNQNERDSSVASLPQNDRLLMALWLGGVVQGILAIYQFLNQSVFGSKWLGMAAQEAMQGGASVVEFGIERWLRAYGSFGSPNSLGVYLAVLFVLGFILYTAVQSARSRILITAGQLIILSGLLLSFSRGAWLSALLGIAALYLVCFFKAKSFLPILSKQIAFTIGVIVFWIIIFYPVFAARFNTHNRLEAQSISERQSQYAEAVSFVRSNPLFGVGPGVYTYALYKKYPDLSFWQYQPVHNIYVLGIVEMGMLGVVSVFLLIVLFMRNIIKNNLIYTPVLVTVLCAGLFDHWLFSLYTGLVFWWVIFGLGVRPTDTIEPPPARVG